MIFGLIGALEQEIAPIREKLRIIDQIELCGYTFLRGKVEGVDIVASCCGTGPVNAAICASLMVRELGVQALINTGGAISSNRELKAMDVVVAQDVAFYDADPELHVKYSPFRKSFPTDDNLRTLCVRVIEGIEGRSYKYRVGRIASGNAFISDSVQRARIMQSIHPLCVDMEVGAVGQVAQMNNIPFLAIKTLTDSAESSADTINDSILESASQNSVAIILQILKMAN